MLCLVSQPLVARSHNDKTITNQTSSAYQRISAQGHPICVAGHWLYNRASRMLDERTKTMISFAVVQSR